MLDLIFMPFTMQFPLSSKYSDLLLTTITFSFWYQTLDMTDKRGATMAELPWPTLNRGESTSRPMGSSDSDMGDDIGHETFAPPAPTIPAATTPAPSSNLAPPPSTSLYNRHQDYAHYGPWTSSTTPGWQLPSIANPRERTVHTIYFKIWDPDSPSRSLYIEEINRQGIVRQFDPEHFFYKLTGNQVQANQMSDYWRSHYGIPLVHDGTPHHPTWAPSTSNPILLWRRLDLWEL